MEIRKAKKSDYEQIMLLYSSFVGDNRYAKKGNDSFLNALNSRTNFIYVAVVDKRLVGFISFSIRRVVRYPKLILEVDEFYVDINSRRQGIGTVLIKIVEKKAKKLNCQRIFIESHYKHKEGHKFYKALGYTNYGYHFIKDVK